MTAGKHLKSACPLSVSTGASFRGRRAERRTPPLRPAGYVLRQQLLGDKRTRRDFFFEAGGRASAGSFRKSPSWCLWVYVHERAIRFHQQMGCSVFRTIAQEGEPGRWGEDEGAQRGTAFRTQKRASGGQSDSLYKEQEGNTNDTPCRRTFGLPMVSSWCPSEDGRSEPALSPPCCCMVK